MTLQGETESDNINKAFLAQVLISAPNFTFTKAVEFFTGRRKKWRKERRIGRKEEEKGKGRKEEEEGGRAREKEKD